jgi:hypothetical protein
MTTPSLSRPQLSVSWSIWRVVYCLKSGTQQLYSKLWIFTIAQHCNASDQCDIQSCGYYDSATERWLLVFSAYLHTTPF